MVAKGGGKQGCGGLLMGWEVVACGAFGKGGYREGRPVVAKGGGKQGCGGLLMGWEVVACGATGKGEGRQVKACGWWETGVQRTSMGQDLGPGGGPGFLGEVQ